MWISAKVSSTIFVSVFVLVVSTAQEYPTCGSCWCVPDGNGLGQCPDWQPNSVFSDSTIQAYKQQIPTSVYSLSCNPYVDATCESTPAQSLIDVDSAVCAFHYDVVMNNSCSTYSMISYSSQAEAEAAGDIVTHLGSCGLCSTAQDLAIYLIEDFTAAGKICATKGLFNEAAGLACYMDIGLTQECAKIWNYDGIYDGKACGSICAKHVSDPNNGPAPACELNECLQCDEDKAGPLFSRFAGRTRRRSGLLSEIVRPCASVARLTHDPCSNPDCKCSKVF